MGISTVEEAVTAIKAGRPIIVTKNDDPKNEGYVVLSAELSTQEWVAWAVNHSSGLLSAPMSNQIADKLDLPMMVEQGENENREGAQKHAYTVTVDAAEGVTTGISANDRMVTLRTLANEHAKPTDVNRPGHILPLRAVDGGVRARISHTEAAVELMKLAGLRPVAMTTEIIADDGEMMRFSGLLELGATENIPVLTIEQLIDYLNERDLASNTSVATQDASVQRRASVKANTVLPTKHGEFRIAAYRDHRKGIDHLALFSPKTDFSAPNVPVRVHSECITGEAFGSLKCECGPQLEAALNYVHENGGIVIYLRGHEGRGIGLANKLRAYQLQEQGVDTLEANIQLGFPADAREYTVAAEILTDLGVTSVKLLTNNPDKVAQLEEHGVTVAATQPLLVGVVEENRFYLETKRDRMGHILPREIS